MKDRNNSKYIKAGLTAFFVIAASIVFYFVVFNTKSFKTGIKNAIGILDPITYGLILAYMLNPIMQWLENHLLHLIKPVLERLKVKLKRGGRIFIRLFCSVLSVFLFFLLVYILVSLLIPQLVESIQSIIRNYPVYEANVINWVNHTFSNPDASETTAGILNYADQLYDWAVAHLPDLESVVTNVTQYVLGVVSFVVNLVIGVIVSIYVLTSKEVIKAKTKRMMFAFFPVRTVNRVLHNVRFVDEKFGGFIIGKVIDSMIIGVICYIVLSLLKMPYTVLISVVIGVTNIIPFFGPIIGAIPCAVLVFVISPLQSVYFVIFVLLLQQFDGNILGPYILGNSTGMSGFMVMMAILICNGFFGIAGAFFGVPLIATIVGFVQAHIRKNITKKKLPRNIDFYGDLAYLDETSLEAVSKSSQSKGASLYDRIKHRGEDDEEGGVSRFLRDASGQHNSDEMPYDPVNITEEEAASNHNIPLVK